MYPSIQSAKLIINQQLLSIDPLFNPTITKEYFHKMGNFCQMQFVAKVLNRKMIFGYVIFRS